MADNDSFMEDVEIEAYKLKKEIVETLFLAYQVATVQRV